MSVDVRVLNVVRVLVVVPLAPKGREGGGWAANYTLFASVLCAVVLRRFFFFFLAGEVHGGGVAYRWTEAQLHRVCTTLRRQFSTSGWKELTAL